MNQKNLVAILGVTILILLGAIIYFTTISNVSQQAPEPVVKQPATPAPVAQTPTPPVAQSAPSVDWQTYKNDKYAYSFSVPSNFRLNIENDDSAVSSIYTSLEINNLIIGTRIFKFSIDNPLECADKKIQDISYNGQTIPLCKETRDNMITTLIPRKDLKSHNPSDYISLEISGEGNGGEKSSIDMLLKIINTLKFTK
jgi:hypothetical protein